TCIGSIFVFQAEDGIRDFHVTGVQTCALPICPAVSAGEDFDGYPQRRFGRGARASRVLAAGFPGAGRPGAWAIEELFDPPVSGRSEERRVGKECRVCGWEHQYKRKQYDVE